MEIEILYDVGYFVNKQFPDAKLHYKVSRHIHFIECKVLFSPEKVLKILNKEFQIPKEKKKNPFNYSEEWKMKILPPYDWSRPFYTKQVAYLLRNNDYKDLY